MEDAPLWSRVEPHRQKHDLGRSFLYQGSQEEGEPNDVNQVHAVKGQTKLRYKTSIQSLSQHLKLANPEMHPLCRKI